MRVCFCFLLLSILASPANAQVHDTLAPAQVRGLRITGADIKDKFAPGVKVQGIDSLTRLPYLADNLAVLLAGATTAAVKSYGFNSFATVSFRGASAAQSAVYWEGIPLMNGATGITDVSLLPVSLIDSISLNYGSSAALLGSGNVGGALMLHDPRPEFSLRPGISSSVSLSAGSFAQYSGSAIVRHTSKRLFISGGISALTAKNNYQVTDMLGKSVLMDHAEQGQLSYTLTTAWKINTKNLLSAHIWQQAYSREIPRALFESHSQKKQRDEDVRFLLKWEHFAASSRTYAKAAFVKSDYNYSDSAIALNSSLQSKHIYAEVGWGGRVTDRGQLLLFAPVQHFYLRSNSNTPTQTRIAIAGAYTHTFLKEALDLGANLRAESFDGDLIVLPGINASYQLNPNFRLRLNGQRTYRAPTLNELYYQPGGNKDLKPEQGWSIDGGYDWIYSRTGATRFTHSLSAYNRHIKDWIIWLGGAIWTPHNLASVHSRGLETENTLTGTFRNVNWRLSLNAAYTRSTTTESYLAGDNSIGCQIPYVPFLTGVGVAGLGWKHFYFEWSSTFTGRRYITTDESAYLTSYTLGNLRIRYSATAKRIPFILQGSVNNVFNADYQVVGFRPMPGVNYRLSLSFSLSSE